MRNYIMTTALFVSAIAVNGAFAEETPVLKVDTTSQEKIQAANETSPSETKNISDETQKASASAHVTTNAQTKQDTITQENNVKNTHESSEHEKIDTKAEMNAIPDKQQKESAQTDTHSHDDDIKNTDKNASNAKSETKTQDDIAGKKHSDDIVTNSVETGNEAEKTEPQGVLDKIMAYFSGE